MDYRISGIHDLPVLDSEIELAPGVWIDGTASMPVPAHACITLTDVTDVTDGEAAVLVRWLRDSFVPASHRVWFANSLVVANGERDPWPLPAGGGGEGIATELRRHLGSVETFVGQSAGHPQTVIGSQRTPTDKWLVRALDVAPPQVRIGSQAFRFNV
ncbi:hypothetical protein [Streptomyces sp. NPDC058625]|uniref:hypothetical protein n=1 Tax=Streptomyces sp. NPDC058625 TaxID=3346564 RepID=UPI00364A80B6